MLININHLKKLNFYLFSINYRALKKPVRVVCVSGGCVWLDIDFKISIKLWLICNEKFKFFNFINNYGIFDLLYIRNKFQFTNE